MKRTHNREVIIKAPPTTMYDTEFSVSYLIYVRELFARIKLYVRHRKRTQR